MTDLITDKLSIPTAAVIIFNKETNRFLLLKNKRGKYGFLTEKFEEIDRINSELHYTSQFPMLQTAIRGIKEELDLEVYFHELTELVSFEMESLINDHIGITFITTVSYMLYMKGLHSSLKINEPNKCTSLEWVTLEELNRLLTIGSLRRLSEEIMKKNIIQNVTLG